MVHEISHMGMCGPLFIYENSLIGPFCNLSFSSTSIWGMDVPKSINTGLWLQYYLRSFISVLSDTCQRQKYCRLPPVVNEKKGFLFEWSWWTHRNKYINNIIVLCWQGGVGPLRLGIYVHTYLVHIQLVWRRVHKDYWPWKGVWGGRVGAESLATVPYYSFQGKMRLCLIHRDTSLQKNVI